MKSNILLPKKSKYFTRAYKYIFYSTKPNIFKFKTLCKNLHIISPQTFNLHPPTVILIDQYISQQQYLGF